MQGKELSYKTTTCFSRTMRHSQPITIEFAMLLGLVGIPMLYAALRTIFALMRIIL